MVSLTGASDASSGGCGRLIRSPGKKIIDVGGKFSPLVTSENINIQEEYALQQKLYHFCDERPTEIAGSTSVDVDNKSLHDTSERDRSRNTTMHETLTDLFWL